MERIKQLSVKYHDRLVGTLALYQNVYAAFEYADEWLADGFSISPLSLPLEKRVFLPKLEPLDGLFGVFCDSLPDGWGRLLVDRLMLRKGMDPYRMGNLERLAIVGDSGMGALCYEPQMPLTQDSYGMSYDEIARECANILRTEASDHLDELVGMGGSSGGARPKILTEVDGEKWIVKFPASSDDRNSGRREYEYALCARACGIEMEEVRLFPSKNCEGYFGTRRFDCSDGNRIHMVSAAGLLETSHRIPNLDYEMLMRLTLHLTHDMRECEKLFRRMCFNVFAHNRDDHSKNFSYLYLENERKWILSPAYDLTYSNSIGGEHATTIHGNGMQPTESDILAVAKTIGIRKIMAEDIMEDVKSHVADML